MTDRNKRSATTSAVVVALLGSALILNLAITDGAAKWVFTGILGVAMIAFLIPVLRVIREGGRP